MTINQLGDGTIAQSGDAGRRLGARSYSTRSRAIADTARGVGAVQRIAGPTYLPRAKKYSRRGALDDSDYSLRRGPGPSRRAVRGGEGTGLGKERGLRTSRGHIRGINRRGPCRGCAARAIGPGQRTRAGGSPVCIRVGRTRREGSGRQPSRSMFQSTHASAAMWRPAG